MAKQNQTVFIEGVNCKDCKAPLPIVSYDGIEPPTIPYACPCCGPKRYATRVDYKKAA